jgi:hypothetical protein
MYYSLINSMNRAVVSSYTARTSAFATATGITDTTILGALNTFDLGLISNGLDTKMKAVYPFVGSTATTQKFNFMDARDLDVAFRLQFNGGWVFSSTGALPNGTNAYANSYYNQTTQGDSLSSGHLSYYSRSNTGAAGINIGTQQTTDVIKYNFLNISNSTSYYFPNNIGGTSFSDTDSRGFYVGNRNSLTNINFWKSGIKKVEGSFANYGNINVNIFIGAMSNNGSPSNYSTKECAFSSIGDGLTDGEASTFYNLVETMQVSLSRAVGYTARTTAFATATGITDTTILGALNTFDLGLISNSLDTKMKALYPMVGGTSTTCKYNFMDARDLDAAFRLQFNGGGTFSSNGYQPNGTNAYANTFLNPTNNLTFNSVSFGIYSRTNSTQGSYGVLSADANLFHHNIGSGNFVIGNYNIGYITYTQSPSTRMIMATRRSANDFQAYRNGTSLGTDTTLSSTNVNGNFYFGARNRVDYYTAADSFTNHELAFSFIGNALTNQNCIDLTNLVNTLQTTLSRQV